MDVRNIPDDFGKFDIVILSGLLYHLTAQDSLKVLKKLSLLCSGMLLIDTHISLRPHEQVMLENFVYHGHTYQEHPASFSQEQKDLVVRASADNNESFWFSRPSLVNLLSFCGFNAVNEILYPPVLHNADSGQLLVDRCTFEAFKYHNKNLISTPDEQFIPEGFLDYSPQESVIITAIKRMKLKLKKFQIGSRFGF